MHAMHSHTSPYSGFVISTASPVFNNKEWVTPAHPRVVGSFAPVYANPLPAGAPVPY